MTRYEMLMKKSDDCLRASHQCGPKFILLWLFMAQDLRNMALALSVEDAGRVV